MPAMVAPSASWKEVNVPHSCTVRGVAALIPAMHHAVRPRIAVRPMTIRFAFEGVLHEQTSRVGSMRWRVGDRHFGIAGGHMQQELLSDMRLALKEEAKGS